MPKTNHMKNLFYLACAILLIVAFSNINCKKEATQDTIVGKWNEVSVNVTTYLNNVYYSDQSLNSDPGRIMEILSNGTGNIYTNYVYDDSFKWKIQGDQFIFTYSSGDISPMKYTVDKTSLTLELTDTEGTGDYVFKYVVVQKFSRD
jgi:hypothetical protein